MWFRGYGLGCMGLGFGVLGLRTYGIWVSADTLPNIMVPGFLYHNGTSNN